MFVELWVDLGMVRTGEEYFTFNNKKLSINVLSFWQWSSSDLLVNVLRGKLAEFIVASSIDLIVNQREEWDAYDLITEKGLKVEIKSSAYLQSWNQAKLSKIIFGIQPTVVWLDNNQRSKTIKRQADIYVFCVLNHKDKKTVNPLNLNQWNFYIIDTKILNSERTNQKTITLSSLLELNPEKLDYSGLKDSIRRYEIKLK